MTERPIHPTRVYPAGTPLPPAAGSPPPPPSLGPDFIPPWRAAPPPPPPPAAPPPAAIEVHHVHTHIVVPAEPAPEPEPESRWSRLWDAITSVAAPWKVAAALAAAVFPIPRTGYSAATTWAYTMSEARAVHVALGYSISLGALALVAQRFRRTRGLCALWGIAVTGIGVLGAASWFDAIPAITGVHR